MGLFDVIMIGIGLSMDAFAVSICKGLSVQKVQPKHAAIAGAYFGGFQCLMPILGYFLGVYFQELIASIDHWIAFILLALIGGNMIREAVSGKEEDTDSDFGVKKMLLLAVATSIDADFGVKKMLLLAVATSIDALAVGITFAFLGVNIWSASVLIGIITFVISAAGIYIGGYFGNKFQSWAEIVGGVVLILIGLKILMEHLGILVL